MPKTAGAPPLLTSRFQQAFALASEIHGTQVRKEQPFRTWLT